MKKRYIVKHDHHHSRYGVYDTADRAITWLGDSAAAASTAAHMNAVDAIGANLNGAISAISTVLTGVLTPERRDYYRMRQAMLRALRDQMPDVTTLIVERARYETPQAAA